MKTSVHTTSKNIFYTKNGRKSSLIFYEETSTVVYNVQEIRLILNKTQKISSTTINFFEKLKD